MTKLSKAVLIATARVRKLVKIPNKETEPETAQRITRWEAAEEELKSLSNRLGMITVIGGVEFRPFSNLTTKWLKEAELCGLIWVIRIDLICILWRPAASNECHFGYHCRRRAIDCCHQQ